MKIEIRNSIIVTVIILLFVSFSSTAFAWQILNLSKETRVFDEYQTGSSAPNTKIARPGDRLYFENDSKNIIIDRQNSKRIENPSFEMLIITEDGIIKNR
jgi:hypothetical protein